MSTNSPSLLERERENIHNFIQGEIAKAHNNSNPLRRSLHLQMAGCISKYLSVEAEEECIEPLSAQIMGYQKDIYKQIQLAAKSFSLCGQQCGESDTECIKSCVDHLYKQLPGNLEDVRRKAMKGIDIDSDPISQIPPIFLEKRIENVEVQSMNNFKTKMEQKMMQLNAMYFGLIKPQRYQIHMALGKCYSLKTNPEIEKCVDDWSAKLKNIDQLFETTLSTQAQSVVTCMEGCRGKEQKDGEIPLDMECVNKCANDFLSNAQSAVKNMADNLYI